MQYSQIRILSRKTENTDFLYIIAELCQEKMLQNVSFNKLCFTCITLE